jgi:adenosylhomocysteine nucleosidase
VVVGMQAEARMARRLGFRIAVGGGTRNGAEVAARQLVAEGALALVSFGLAGGLQPPLLSGKILVPREVLLRTGERYPTDPGLSARLGGVTPHAVLGGDHIIAEPKDKRLLWKLTGAAAVDLESGAVAKVATEFGLPFAVLRVICDPATQLLPEAAMGALDQGGKLSLVALLGSVARHPLQIADLFRLAGHAFVARAALAKHVRKLRISPGKTDKLAAGGS